MEKQWDIIEVLRHSRHDWMNKLQLIKGNIDLNRIDRVKAVIDEIIIEAQNETKLSNLPMPGFVSLLLKTNWENPSFELEYEVFVEKGTVKIDDEILTNWTKQFFLCLHNAIEAFQENHLSITIESQLNGLRFFFDFSGIIRNKELIETFLAEERIPLDLTVKEFSQNELALEVFMPAV
ncbi:Spo0B C-terminal domain-containing protein [Neobacillus mesonae]|uniref:Spo0B C-terminal domain-containing protein n=1 Tax=Neobacillus mesonae TaxID=1193713 RepID=UPI00204232DE|nr:Spo0B C-terminal domain-containing protein [Neobacillus mesonae]MCM3568411.1 sporulation initiation phosphotransferase B [Neobacillus mesonae]